MPEGTESQNPSSLIGRVFDGRFKIEALIGKGGMGAVYRAQQLSMDKPVALKVLSKHLAEEERQVQRFNQEALTSSKLKHPNTIRVLDYGHSDDGYLYLAMELLEGHELSKVIREGGAMGLQRSVKIARQMCKSIGEAHQVGLVHRDLKPDNVFLCEFYGEKDFVKVLDFGIAKFMEDVPGQESLTQTGFICGTPLYIAPEQALGRPVTPRTDLYSLGVILYEMLCGSPPFRADTPIAIVMRHIHDTPAPMTEFKPDLICPPELENLVFSLLQKDPRARPSSAEEIGLVLEDLLTSGLLAPARPRRSSTFSSIVAVPKEGTDSRVEGAPMPAKPVVSDDRHRPVPPSQPAADAAATTLESNEVLPIVDLDGEPKAALDADPQELKAPGPSVRPASEMGYITGANEVSAEAEPKKRTGLFIGVASALVAVGVAAFLIMGGDSNPSKAKDPATASRVNLDRPADPARAKPAPVKPAGSESQAKVAGDETPENKAGAEGDKAADAKQGDPKGEGDKPADKAEDNGDKPEHKAGGEGEAIVDAKPDDKPPEPEKPAPYKVQLESVPPGAEVLNKDKVFLGNTPTSLVLTEERPSIKLFIKAAGYEERELVIDRSVLEVTQQSKVTVSLEKTQKRPTIIRRPPKPNNTTKKPKKDKWQDW